MCYDTVYYSTYKMKTVTLIIFLSESDLHNNEINMEKQQVQILGIYSLLCQALNNIFSSVPPSSFENVMIDSKVLIYVFNKQKLIWKFDGTLISSCSFIVDEAENYVSCKTHILHMEN